MSVLLDLSTAHQMLDVFALLLLLSSLWAVITRRLDHSIYLLGCQGLILSGTMAVVALYSGTLHAYVGFAVTLIVKVIAVPGILLYALREVHLKREVHMVVSSRQALLVAVALVLVSYYVMGPMAVLDEFYTRNALPVALSLLLIGLLNMFVRKKALNQIIGLVGMDNGLYFLGVVATRGLPIAVELGVAVDVLIAALVMGMLTRWIHQTFDSINTDHLRTLKG